MRALDAAKAAGAEYADVRIAQYRSQSVQTRERACRGSATPRRPASASARS